MTSHSKKKLAAYSSKYFIFYAKTVRIQQDFKKTPIGGKMSWPAVLYNPCLLSLVISRARALSRVHFGTDQLALNSQNSQ